MPSLRHGTNGFTSLPKEGVLSIFSALKNPTASAGFEPANLGYHRPAPYLQTTEAAKLELRYIITKSVVEIKWWKYCNGPFTGHFKIQ